MNGVGWLWSAELGWWERAGGIEGYSGKARHEKLLGSKRSLPVGGQECVVFNTRGMVGVDAGILYQSSAGGLHVEALPHFPDF